ncbi:hypothetical protein [Alloacidobacterium sp.]|uniref:hypothetical protein n=1 Tax=Alloacidobacterium sp. TaxID=2951999 RepID=UPI002D6BD526|nr:hypothetical protein [Alloacidobacterium sp.]HYK38138.1 hypothetical protein [Alloacidobacterium sp.]
MSLLLCRFLGIPLAPDIGPRHFSHYLLSIFHEFRAQMHTSGLYVGVFAALGFAGLLWVIAEKRQHDSEWDHHDVIWMVSFEALLVCSAILYRWGTHSAMARRFAMAGTMADVFGIGVAFSVPAILWFHWNKPKPKTKRYEDDDSISSSHISRTILGLEDYTPPPLAPVAAPLIAEMKEIVAVEAHIAMPIESTVVEVPAVTPPVESIIAASFTETPPVNQPTAMLETPLPEPIELSTEAIANEAIVMDNNNNVDVLSTNSQPPASTPQSQPEAAPPFAPQPFAAHQAPPEPMMSQQYTPQPMAAPQPMGQPAAYQPMAAPPSSPERPSAPGTTFRDQLYALNASWQRIESTGKEVEDWFQQQQKMVLAHLERPARSHDPHMDLSRDFLEQRMGRVDGEWAAIQRTVREIYHWLENGGSEQRAMPQETKVW